MKTYQPKHKDIKRDWHLIDVKGKVLGRAASEIVKLLMGKHKVNYAPHMDMGDFVVVVNAKDVELTGRKEKQKVYKSHSGFPGGYKEVAYLKMQKDHPEKIVEMAVNGMLPKNRLQDKRIRRLKVFTGGEHTYREKFKEGVKPNN
jgi:large subunit ribosomal protein L13